MEKYKPHGAYSIWDRKGNLIWRGYFFQGKLFKENKIDYYTGTMTFSYPNGTAEVPYKDGLRNGPVKVWWTNKQLRYEAEYENGLKKSSNGQEAEEFYALF